MTSFQIIALGCSGGPYEDNLSSLLLAPAKEQTFVALDAGTLLGGIRKAVERGAFGKLEDPHLKPEGVVLRSIKAYLLSHAHLDHVGALVINSQVDESKPLLGLPHTLEALRTHLFNGRIWANYGSEGEGALKLYRAVELVEAKERVVEGTPFSVEAFGLEHAERMPSTAFLIRHKEAAFLYFGDVSGVGPKARQRLDAIWKRVAPLWKEGVLKGMAIECSYPRVQRASELVGHLDTAALLGELDHLASMTGPLKGLPVLVMHRKESLLHVSPLPQIERELKEGNSSVRFIFPTQGERLLL